MASFEKPKSAEGVPLDLLPVIRSSGVLGDRQLAEIKNKVLQGDYPDRLGCPGRAPGPGQYPDGVSGQAVLEQPAARA